jgi:hypothetical protein
MATFNLVGFIFSGMFTRKSLGGKCPKPQIDNGNIQFIQRLTEAFGD